MQFLWDSESCQFTLEKNSFFAYVVTWELLGNIRSEELVRYIISRVQTERAICWGAEVPLAGEAEVAWVQWQVTMVPCTPQNFYSTQTYIRNSLQQK